MEDTQELAKLIKALDKISPDLWSKTLLHVRIESALEIVGSLVVFIIFASWAVKMMKSATWSEDMGENLRASTLLALALGGVALVTGFQFVGGLAFNIADIVSPEMDAVAELLKAIKEEK